MARPAGPRLSIPPLLWAMMEAGIEYKDLPKNMQNNLDQGRKRGFLTEAQADKFACEILGEHPIVIWGKEYEALSTWGNATDYDLTPLKGETPEQYAKFLSILEDGYDYDAAVYYGTNVEVVAA